MAQLRRSFATQFKLFCKRLALYGTRLLHLSTIKQRRGRLILSGIVVLMCTGAAALWWYYSQPDPLVYIEDAYPAYTERDEGITALDKSADAGGTDGLDATSSDASQAADTAQSTSKHTGTSADEPARKRGDPLTVHVAGAVEHPGVYVISYADARLEDALLAAGGATAEADVNQLNLAERIQDAQKIYVPRVGESGALGATTSTQTTSGYASSDTSGVSQRSASLRVNINTATVTELMQLPGIGEATAQTIIKDREKLGAFTTPQDIMRVSGIGEKKYEKIKDYIHV